MLIVPTTEYILSHAYVGDDYYSWKYDLYAFSPHLIINLKFLHNTKLQKHAQGGGNHGIIVQRKVIEVELINSQLAT